MDRCPAKGNFLPRRNRTRLGSGRKRKNSSSGAEGNRHPHRQRASGRCKQDTGRDLFQRSRRGNAAENPFPPFGTDCPESCRQLSDAAEDIAFGSAYQYGALFLSGSGAGKLSAAGYSGRFSTGKRQRDKAFGRGHRKGNHRAEL